MIELYPSQSLKTPHKLTYTIKEVAKTLNISVGHAYKLVNDGIIPSVKLGKRILVSKEKLEAFING